MKKQLSTVTEAFVSLLFDVENTDNGDLLDLTEVDAPKKAVWEAARLAVVTGLVEFTNQPTLVRVLDNKAALAACERIEATA